MKLKVITALDYEDRYTIGILLVPEGRSFRSDACEFYTKLARAKEEKLALIFLPATVTTRREGRTEKKRRLYAEIEAYRQVLEAAGTNPGKPDQNTYVGMEPALAEALISHLLLLGYIRLPFSLHHVSENGLLPEDWDPEKYEVKSMEAE